MASSSSSSPSSSSSSSSRSVTSSQSPSPAPFEPPQELLNTYQSLLSNTFDLTGLLPTQPLNADDDDDDDEGGRPMTKAEKQNAKKKRRKEREREAKLAESGMGPSQAKPDASIGAFLSLVQRC
jgi:hypothetical protein